MEIDNNALWMGIGDNWGYAISNLDIITGQAGLQLMSPLCTVKFSVLVNRSLTGIFSITGDSHFSMDLSSSCGDVQLS
ncbi:hypothetical protein CFP56_012752 [Quercus suber]|uniref:Uncharacterized protein n=1 Tax=Quercus suber TaxID=58331 RepID=A0AAW0KWZ1_QUESU